MSALPAATAREIRAYARRVIRAYPRDFGLVACLEALAATAGLFVPWLLGELVADVSHGHDTVLRMVALICLFLASLALDGALIAASALSAAFGRADGVSGPAGFASGVGRRGSRC